VLLANGISGTLAVLDGVTGKARTIANIEAAAKLAVREDRRKGPCFVRWKPLTKTSRERVEGRPPAAERAAPKDKTGAARQRRYRSRHHRNGAEAAVAEDPTSVTDEPELPLIPAE
jgi:hypothetical protein